MVVVQACKLSLPQISSLSSPEVSSLLFDPHSHSLALMHSDFSFSLYPSLSSPLLLSSLPTPQTLIPAPSSSAAFLRLQSSNPNSTPRVLFLVASPVRGGAFVLLRFWILCRSSQSFAKARVICNQSGLQFDDGKSGVVFAVNHGVSIKLAGSINVFVMYSVSNCKIWVFAAKMVDVEDDGVTVKLMKCAAIDCCVPVFAISVSLGFLILGEENGVRVFPLRPLVKGRVKGHRRESKNLIGGLKSDKFEGQRLNLLNGVIQTINGTDVLYSDSGVHFVGSGRVSKLSGGERTLEISSNVYLEGKNDNDCDIVKSRSVNLRQDSKEGGIFFVAFKNKEVRSYKSTEVPLQSAKAISIQALLPTKFLVLDSYGDLHLLYLSNPNPASDIPCRMLQLTKTMKVQKLAVLPDVSINSLEQRKSAEEEILRHRTQMVWISDGCHTVHTLAVPDVDTSVSEIDQKDSEEKEIQISVIQAILASEKIQDMIPLATNAILILGQGCLFAYAIS